jgi:hypothetical protein
MRNRDRWMIVVMLSVLASSAFGQATTQPATGSSLPAGQMLDKMLAPPPAASSGRPLVAPTAPPAVDATSGKGAVAPAAPQVTVLREGTYIVDRTGRLTKSADGSQQEFAFDSDGRTMADPPLVILPNLTLMAMENAVATNSRDLRFRITGVLTEYRQRNYILLEKAVVVPEISQQF